MIQKQTVYLPIEKAITNWLKPKEGYFFTPEQLNEYTANVIKQALKTAAEKADTCLERGIMGDYYRVVDKQSIIQTFEETFKQFNMTTCSKNGIKKEGESCSLNNNCIYPDCLEKNFTEKDIIDFAQFVAENAHFKNDGDWLYKSGIYSTKELLQKFLNSKQ